MISTLPTIALVPPGPRASSRRSGFHGRRDPGTPWCGKSRRSDGRLTGRSPHRAARTLAPKAIDCGPPLAGERNLVRRTRERCHEPHATSSSTHSCCPQLHGEVDSALPSKALPPPSLKHGPRRAGKGDSPSRTHLGLEPRHSNGTVSSARHRLVVAHDISVVERARAQEGRRALRSPIHGPRHRDLVSETT